MEDRILYGRVINRLGELITLAVFSLTDLILCGLQYKKESGQDTLYFCIGVICFAPWNELFIHDIQNIPL